MSIGNPKKYTLAKELAKDNLDSNITRVHKNKRNKINKELSFSTKSNKSKLV